jgi:hypothetical protein
MAAALGAFEKIPHSVATACGKFGGFEPSNKSTVARQATYVFCEWNPADTFSGCLAAASNQLGEQSFVIPNIEQRRIRVLEKQLRDAWHARQRAVPIQPIMTFASEGLVLGAGTVLIPSEGPRRLHNLRGRQAHVLALLSAAYGRAVAPSVLGNIERAVTSWRDGEECLAYVHLAHSRLQVPSDVRTAAYRLFVAEHAMKAGVSASAVFQALNIDRSYIDAVEKAYNPAQPRVPAGSGRTSAAPCAYAASKFDGAWSAVFRTKSGPCPPATRGAVQGANGIIEVASTAGSLSGRVSRTGVVRATGHMGANYGAAAGRVSGNFASGTWQAHMAGGSCVGVWTAQRR